MAWRGDTYMSNLVVLGFENELAADAFISKIENSGDEGPLTVDNLVKVTVDPDGQAKLHHEGSLVSGGAVFGGFLGTLVGSLFLSPIAGAAIGAAGGAAIGAASGGHGLSDDFVKETSEMLAPGSAALFMLVESRMPTEYKPRSRARKRLLSRGTLSGSRGETAGDLS